MTRTRRALWTNAVIINTVVLPAPVGKTVRTGSRSSVKCPAMLCGWRRAGLAGGPVGFHHPRLGSRVHDNDQQNTTLIFTSEHTLEHYKFMLLMPD